MTHFDVIIIGSGPSGLMAASQINNKSVLLIERNSNIGGKIKVSGGGRCNVTNNKELEAFLLNVPKNNKFLYSTLNLFGPAQIINFLTANGVELHEEKHNKIFPKSNKSIEIINTFEKILINNNVKIKTNFEVTKVLFKGEKYIVNDVYTSSILIVATGGCTYKHLGTTGFGYDIASSFDIQTTKTYPVETPLVSNSKIIASKDIQGISLRDVKGTLLVKNKAVFSTVNDVLFTHFGLSGPLALQSSFYVNKALVSNKKPITFKIDLPDDSNIIIPKKLKPYIIDDKIELEINDVRGAKHGFVTDGGISLKEINPKTFEAKNQKNLFFVGEVLDVNAFTGGYNITICLSEGYSVANYINSLSL